MQLQVYVDFGNLKKTSFLLVKTKNVDESSHFQSVLRLFEKYEILPFGKDLIFGNLKKTSFLLVKTKM